MYGLSTLLPPFMAIVSTCWVLIIRGQCPIYWFPYVFSFRNCMWFTGYVLTTLLIKLMACLDFDELLLMENSLCDFLFFSVMLCICMFVACVGLFKFLYNASRRGCTFLYRNNIKVKVKCQSIQKLIGKQVKIQTNYMDAKF